MTTSVSPNTDSVEVTSKLTVRCANETSWTALESPFRLGPLNALILPYVPIAVVFVYEHSTDVELIPVDHLERALTRLLDYYPHLTGRLQANPSDGAAEIARLGTGAELFIARCKERLDAFSSPGPGRILMLPGAGNALLAPYDGSLEGVCRDPILTVQHTRFACGSVALGVRVHHIVADAEGFFQLVRDMAEMYRGVVSGSTLPSLAHPPHIRPYMSDLDMTPEEWLEALDFQPSEIYVDPTPSADVSFSLPSSYVPPSLVVGRFLHISSRELNALKAHAAAPTGTEWVSSFDALSAHLCQRIYLARLKLCERDASQVELSPPNFLSPVNLRSRLDLPPHYFPYSLTTVYTTLTHDVLTGPLWKVAKVIHDLTRTPRTTSKEEMNATLKWIAAQPDKKSIKDRFQYGNGTIMASQWNKFDMYAGTVFDVPPVLVSPPFTPISLVDGLAYFLPNEEQGKAGSRDVDFGAIELNLALSAPIWEILDRDEEFRRFRDT